MKKRYSLNNLECANCANKMEREIQKLSGVQSVNISFLMQRMVIETDDESHDEIMAKVSKICKKIEPDCEILI